MITDDVERRVREEFVRPIGAGLTTNLPGQIEIVGHILHLPFGFRVPHKSVRALAEHEIRHRDFSRHIDTTLTGAVGA